MDILVIFSVIAGFVFAAGMLVLASRRFVRTKGREMIYHYIFVGIVIITTLFCPLSIKEIIFSSMGITTIGMVFPIYESLRAICSPQAEDDMAWLQYWVSMSGIYFLGAYISSYNMGGDHIELLFRQFEFWYFLWLHLPFTDGSSLIYEYITLPYFLPWIKPMSEQMNKAIKALYQIMINAIHLWLLWIFFIILPSSLKRFVSIAVGTIYPLFESIVAVNTEDTDDDTFWLTYWSCFGVFFLVVDFIDGWLGFIPGFYTLVILCTVYLMLPMFRGSERLFRNVLVPLCGLREMLIMRDALNVKKDILMNIPEDRRDAVRAAIAKSFSGTGTEDDEQFLKETGAKREKKSRKYGGGGGGVFSSFRRNNNNNVTSTDDSGGAPTETTPIV